MKETESKKRYTRPEILSERVFEQSALACGHVAYDAVAANLVNYNLKASQAVCGFTSS